MKKSELRRRFLLLQRSISPQERVDKSEAVSDLFFGTFDLRSFKYLHLFLPIEKFNEIDTGPIVRRVWSEFAHIQILVPRVDFQTNEMHSLKFGPDTQLERNIWDIKEPAHNDLVDAENIDIVLVPGLCFDRRGHRVGYGKGFYDKFLKTCSADCFKIGLSYFEPVESIDDLHEGDVQLDIVITPGEVIQPGRPIKPSIVRES